MVEKEPLTVGKTRLPWAPYHAVTRKYQTACGSSGLDGATLLVVETVGSRHDNAFRCKGAFF